VIIGTTSIRLSEDNHDSWVMSGMDPHKISGSPGFGWFGLVGLVWFGWFVEVDLIRLWFGHGETP
jgi:hypothetical protein